MNPSSTDASMRKPNSIQKALSPGNPNESVDQFELVKQKIIKSLSDIRTKTEEKERKILKFGANIETVKLGAEIQNDLKELDRQLDSMGQVLRQQHKNHRKSAVRELELKDKIFQNFLTQKQELKAKEEVYQGPQFQTITEIYSGQSGDLDERPRGRDGDLTAEEEKGLETFKENDEKQEEILGEINRGLEDLTQKAKGIEGLSDKQGIVICSLDTQVTKAMLDVKVSNSKLKSVLVRYKKPEKLCMDICLILVLLGLIAVIIKMSTECRGYFN